MRSPTDPAVRHVWIKDAYGVGRPSAGTVVAWMPAPVRTSSTAAWAALVIWCPNGAEIMNVSWVGADRLDPVRDDAPY